MSEGITDEHAWPRRAAYTVGLSHAQKTMAKPNYSFEKRQRELAKKKKQEEKQAKKRADRDAAKPVAPQQE